MLNYFAVDVLMRGGADHRSKSNIEILYAEKELEGNFSSEHSLKTHSYTCDFLKVLCFGAGAAMNLSDSGLLQGSGFFLAGVATVLYGWAVLGMCLESYGFWVLFSGFFPTILGYLRGIPMLGSFLDTPFLKSVSFLRD